MKFAVIFDMDGTLVDNTPYHFKSWQAMYKKYSLGDFTIDTYHREISGIPVFTTIRRLFGADHDEAQLQALFKEKEAMYRELYLPFVAPINGLENFLADLQNSGVKMAMASSATMEDINFILDHVPIRQYFDAIIDGSRVSKGKPDPQIFLKAASDLEMLPERCVVFEDSIAGIKAGNAARMKVVGITTGNPPEKLQPSSLVIDDYIGLTFNKMEALFS